MNTEYIHKLEREHIEQELRHKQKQIEYETKQKLLDSGINIITQQMTFNIMTLFNLGEHNATK